MTPGVLPIASKTYKGYLEALKILADYDIIKIMLN